MSELNHVQVWWVILGLGLGTYLLRVSFLAIIGDRKLPEWLMRHLRYTAVAVMPALVAPMVVWPDKALDDVSIVRICAALVAVGIGMWRASVVLTIVAGVATLLALQYLGFS